MKIGTSKWPIESGKYTLQNLGIMGDDPSPKENTVFLYVIIIWACQKKGSKMRDASRHDFPGPQRPLR